MAMPDAREPWLGLDASQLRFLEAHQARAVAIPGRGWRDLGDAVMLFSAAESEPFFNRLVAVRWPSDTRAFEARLAEACQLFEALDRRPYLWLIPGVSEPQDIVARLAATGFVDQGGGYDMVMVRPPNLSRQTPLPPRAVLHHWNRSSPDEIPDRAEILAEIIGDCFEIPFGRHANLVREISLTLERTDFHAYVICVDGRPVATGQRYTFDCASYLSSIGTTREWRGRGLASRITQVLAADSLRDGANLVYLGVYTDNTPAIRLYEGLGFSILGERSADMLKDRPA
jgi:ribosomal-protein-alanine N-acetyltransferase